MSVDVVLFMCRVRTSSGMFLNRGEDDIVDRIEARIAKHTAIPKENGEGLQILHYQVPKLSMLIFRLTPAPKIRPCVLQKLAWTFSKRYTHETRSLQSLQAPF